MKIVVVALCAGIVVTGVGLLSRDTGDDTNTHAARVIKAGKPVIVTDSGDAIVR